MRNSIAPALSLLCALACTPAPPTPVTGDLAIVGAVLLDPRADTASTPSTVVISGDRITAVGPVGDVRLAEGVPTVDATGIYLIPGLWDLHTHLGMSEDWALRLMVTQGVTGVRDLGGDPAAVETVRRRVLAGDVLGPRMVRAGPTLNGAPNAPHHRVIDSPEAARQAVADLRDAGVDVIKTHNATDRDTYFALLDAAREAGLTVAGHVPVTVTPREACEAGHASVEHIATLFEGTYLSGFDSELEAFQGMSRWVDEALDALVACFAEQGTLFVPTLRVYELRARQAAWHDDPPDALRCVPAELGDAWYAARPVTAMARDPEVIALRMALVEIGQEVVRRLDRAGAPLGTGTDNAGPVPLPGVGIHNEMRLFVGAGLSPQRALLAATRGPGEDAVGEALTGRLVAGAPADLVLLGADPFESLDALDRIEGVVLRGRLLDRATLDAELAALEGSGP